jgi:bifunctional pyridoxal-dependent enzyme with beta-cystathionase and maltose regulon repressor activities
VRDLRILAGNVGLQNGIQGRILEIRIIPRGTRNSRRDVMLCSIAHALSQEDLSAVKTLEQETGKTLLAFFCHPTNPSSLSPTELERIQELEKKLGVALVAVDPQA